MGELASFGPNVGTVIVGAVRRLLKFLKPRKSGFYLLSPRLKGDSGVNREELPIRPA